MISTSLIIHTTKYSYSTDCWLGVPLISYFIIRSIVLCKRYADNKKASLPARKDSSDSIAGSIATTWFITTGTAPRQSVDKLVRTATGFSTSRKIRPRKKVILSSKYWKTEHETAPDIGKWNTEHQKHKFHICKRRHFIKFGLTSSY